MTDDLDSEVYRHMTRLHQAMDEHGLAFSSHFVSLSLCCPSRAAILSGQFAHNNGIYNNAPPGGGFETFFSEGLEAKTLAVYLENAGYRTVMLGKYLNGYPNSAPVDYIPVGWSEWYSPVDGYPYIGTQYTMNENGTEVQYGRYDLDPADYFTDVLTRKATDFIDRMAQQKSPYFMYITPYNPHAPATPPIRYRDDFPGARAPRTPSFNEADISDKPSWMQANPLLTTDQIADVDALYRRELQCMEAVEDMVDAVIAELAATGQLDNTYIVFTSDNGLHHGQHRFPSGKDTEFDEDLFVPLVIRGPGIAQGTTTDIPTLNVDFAPTFLELGGVAVPDDMDGRSLVPLFGSAPPTSWRHSVLLEHGRDFAITTSNITSTTAPPGTLEPSDQLFSATAARINAPPYVGVRTSRYTYIMYQNGERELYDHVLDPAELTNTASSADPALLARLAGIIGSLRDCVGAECRRADQAGD